MRRRPNRLAVLLALLLIPTVAGSALALDAAAERAAAVDLVELDAGSLGRSAQPRSVRLPLRADMLAATWRGSADAVELRAQGGDGRWSRWVVLHQTGDGPDADGAEARAARARVARRSAADPVWVGDARRVQVRSHAGERARDVRIVAINASGTATAAERALGTARASAAWLLGEAVPAAEAMPVLPLVNRRTAWKAAKPRSAPAYTTDGDVLGAVVHHTDGGNRYACSDVPAMLRGIQRYHQQTQGWNDIGYNFLVDRCGGIWEGRAGGLDKPVIGAHAGGFNTATAGVALLGNHQVTTPSTQARIALQRLLAWRLDVAHVKPNGTMTLTARASDRFSAGSQVRVRAISGHRDLLYTSCPGARQYTQLGALALAAWRTGGPKVANITRSFELANPDDPLDATLRSVRVRAVTSAAAMRGVVQIVRISTGEVLQSTATVGFVIGASWTAPPGVAIPAWDVRVLVDGTHDGRRARGASLPLIAAIPTDPGFVVTTPPAASVTRGGDPVDDLVQLQYTLGADYRLGAWLHDPVTGEQVAELLEPSYVGVSATPVPLELEVPEEVAAGSYELRVGLAADPAAGRSLRRFALTVLDS